MTEHKINSFTSYNEVLDMSVKQILNSIKDKSKPIDPTQLEKDILTQMALIATPILITMPKDAKWKIPSKLQPSQIADIILNLYNVV